MMKKRPSIIKTLIFATIFFIGGFTAYKHLTKPIFEEARDSETWPTVMGTITSSELAKSRDSDGKTMYSANIKYNYIVDSIEYYGTDIKSLNGSTSMKSSVKKTLRNYTKGKEVTVYFDPEFPSTAVLEPGIGLLFGLLLKIPLLFCFISVLMVFNLFKRIIFG